MIPFIDFLLPAATTGTMFFDLNCQASKVQNVADVDLLVGLFASVDHLDRFN